MSEENQENGTANGVDVPEIELIIKVNCELTNIEGKDGDELLVVDDVVVAMQKELTVDYCVESERLDKAAFASTIMNSECEGHKIHEPKKPLAQLDCNRNGSNASACANANANASDANDDADDDDAAVNNGAKKKCSNENRKSSSCIKDMNCCCCWDVNRSDASDGGGSINYPDATTLATQPILLTTTWCRECKGHGWHKGASGRIDDALEMAVNAVIHEGLSLGEASKKYNVKKTRIWTRVRKHPKRRRRERNTKLIEAIESQLMAGQTLADISRTLNVAKSTVYLYKSRLVKGGTLPPGPIVSDSDGMRANEMEARLREAHRACRVNGMSVSFAAEFYSVSATTLWRYIKKCKRNENM